MEAWGLKADEGDGARTKGSVMILKARAAKGSSSEEGRVVSSSPSMEVPLIASTSNCNKQYAASASVGGVKRGGASGRPLIGSLAGWVGALSQHQGR